MTPLRWTREAPKEAGRYWISCNDPSCAGMCPDIVRVFFKQDGALAVAWDGAVMSPSDEMFPIVEDAIRWAGPIAPPEEAT